MKIIKVVDITQWKKLSTCRVCFTELEVDLKDLVKSSKLEGSTIPFACHYYCPICKNNNSIELSEIEPQYQYHIPWEKEY